MPKLGNILVYLSYDLTPATLVGMEAAQSGCQLKVGIVGAGIAGLSAAIGLCKAGHEVEVKDP